MLAREVSVTEKEAFNKLASHITQSWEWGDFRLKTGKVPQISRLGFFNGKKLVHSYQIFFHQVPYFNRLIAYMPRTFFPDKPEMKAIEDACRRAGAVYLKMEPNETEGAPATAIFRTGRTILPSHSFILNITPDLEEILGRMHEKTRYNIKVAQKKGVIVTQKDDDTSLSQFIELHDQTQRRQGFYAKTGDYIKTLWAALRPAGMVHLLCAYAPGENDPIAAVMLFNFKGTLYYPYGGWSARHREMMPNNLLHFEAIKLGKDLGCTTYDLWSSYENSADAKDPWYGTYIFKKGFAPTEVNYVGAFDIPFEPQTYQMMELADSLRWKYLKVKRLIGI